MSMILKAKKKGWISGPAAFYKAASPPAGPTLTYRGSGFENSGFTTGTYSIDIGTASADRLVVVGVVSQNAPNVTSVIVNGVSLVQDAINNPAPSAFIWSGLVTSGSGSQTIVVTYDSGGFINKYVEVWTLTGLSSNTVKHTTTFTNSGGSINVTAGDLMVAVGATNGGGTPPNWASSDQAPTRSSLNSSDPAPNSASADWVIASTSAAFDVISTGAGVGGKYAAATYR